MNEIKTGAAATVASMGDRALRDDFDALRDDFKRLRSDLAGTARHAAAAAKDGVTEVKNRASHAYDAARKSAGEARDTTVEKIEEHPLAAVGIAFGVGLLVGAVLLRSRR